MGRPRKDLAAQLRDYYGDATLAAEQARRDPDAKGAPRNRRVLILWCRAFLHALSIGEDHRWSKAAAAKVIAQRFHLSVRQVNNIVQTGMRLNDLPQAESERQRMQAQVLERAQQLSASYLPADAALAPELQLAFALLGEHGARLKAEKSAAELQSQLGAKRTRDTANAAVPAYRRPAETKQPPKR